MNETPKVEWTMVECDSCFKEVESINLQEVKLSDSNGVFAGTMWMCDDCRKKVGLN